MYSDAQTVKEYTNVGPEDFGFATLDELDAWIEARLTEIKSLIDADRNQDFSDPGPAPEGINRIALEMAGNLITLVQSRRTTPVVQVDDYRVMVNDGKVFTDNIKEALRRWPKETNIRLMRV